MIIPIREIRGLQTISLLFVLFVFVFSCRNSGDITGEKASVKVNLLDVENGLIDEKIQKIIVPFNKNYSLVATLVPNSSSKNISAANKSITELKPGTAYKVIAYNSNG